MEKKQTAVECLIDLFSETIDEEFYKKEIDQAKAMEIKQLSKSYHKGVRHEWEGAGGNFQDYYEETYGNDTSI